LESLIKYSRIIGHDFSLIQGAGGNTSLKNGGRLWVKASGFELGSIDKAGFIEVDRYKLIKLIANEHLHFLGEHERDHFISQELNKCIVDGNKGIRPSIETFFHALLPQKYVVHVHSILINGITCRDQGIDIAVEISDICNWSWVPYSRPGLALALAIKDVLPGQLDQLSSYTLFLENHGIVIAAHSLDEIDKLLNRFKLSILDYLGPWQWSEPIGYDSYHLAMPEPQIYGALYPDHVVFCGGIGIVCSRNDLATSMDLYQHKYNVPCKYGVVDGELTIFDTKDAHAFLRFIKAHVDTYQLTLRNNGQPKFLHDNDVTYLLQWESEKFRQKLNEQ